GWRRPRRGGGSAAPAPGGGPAGPHHGRRRPRGGAGAVGAHERLAHHGRVARGVPEPGAMSGARIWPHPGSRGQATVELVAILPLGLLVALTIAQLLAAGSARELAGNAAEAGAAALLQGSDPGKAARDALPGWSRGRATRTA